MGIGEKKCLSYPRERPEMGTGEKKMLSYPRKAWKWVQKEKMDRNTQKKRKMDW